MDQGPLVKEEIEAGKRFLDEFDKAIPVRVAFWIKDIESGKWKLYVASDRIDDTNRGAAYEEVLRVAREMDDPEFDPYQVRVIGPDSRLVQAVLDFRRRFPGRRSDRFGYKFLGDLVAAAGYVYPAPISVA